MPRREPKEDPCDNPGRPGALRRLRVLVVDESARARRMLADELTDDSMIEVVGMAASPAFAHRKILSLNPDLMTLAVNLAAPEALSCLRKSVVDLPHPLVVATSLSEWAASVALEELGGGALEMLGAPGIPGRTLPLAEILKAAARRFVPRRGTIPLPPPARLPIAPPTHLKIVAVGASTGGTEALRDLLIDLPENAPGMVIVQHMPEHFTRAFADRLNQLCAVEVKEAENGDSVIPGRVLIAPGAYHMMLRKVGARYVVEVKDGPLISRHRPSVDVLFKSVARAAGKNAVGILLTGMGRDGAEGMKEMHGAGALTIAQDEASCVVFGMPKEAIALGAVNFILPLREIPRKLLALAAGI
jgi:two-component system chemotaxis response regulator CheB